MLKRTILLLIITFIVTSCRCKTDFKIISETSKSTDGEKIEVSAGIWQGQYEFINFNIQIAGMENLNIESIIVKPTLKDGKFPKLSDYRMFSNYKIENGKLEKKSYQEQYIEKDFKNLPEIIRKTNIGDDMVYYSITYSDNRNIEISEFSAAVEVILTDENGKEIMLERSFEFYGEEECYFSSH